MSLEEALLNQKIEFLSIELEEARRRENSLKENNESLLAALGEGPEHTLNDYHIFELEKSNSQHIKDIQLLKKRLKQTQSELEKENRTLRLSNKELSFELKHLKSNFQTYKCE